MSISAINAAASFEAPKQSTAKTVKAEPVEMAATREIPAQTQPVAASNGSETGYGSEEQQGKENEKNLNMVKNAVNKANNTLKQKHARTKCEFSYHEGTKRVSIKVLDKDTDEVIREIPPEETLEMVEKMWELAGILVDERR